MAMDLNPHREGGFPVDRPMEALKEDHALVRQLFDSYLNTQDLSEKKDIRPQLLMRLDMHMSIEEGIFYPRVRGIDSALVDRCDAEHQQAKQMMEQLRRMDEGEPQAEQLFRQLADAIRRHLDVEEQQLFPKVQQANLDLTAIGVDMQAFEASMLTSGGLASARPGMRQ